MLKQSSPTTKLVGPPMQPAPLLEHTAGRRETLARVTRQLESAIEAAGLRNEPRLPPERELAHTLGVSRSTVREAVQRLIARGLLEAHHGRGLFIRRVLATPGVPDLPIFIGNANERGDMLEFRLAVECAAARLAAVRASDSELEQMQRIVDRMNDAVQTRNVKAEALADAQFHLALARASHNRMLGTLYVNEASALSGHVVANTLQASAIDSASHRLASARLAQHRAICDAVCAHRPRAAADAMRAHIEFIGRQFDAGD